jgi:hypothetical protein
MSFCWVLVDAVFQKDHLLYINNTGTWHQLVDMSEWLRRQTRNLLGLSCAGSNPAVDAFCFFWLHQILCPTAILHSCWLLHSAARRSESNAFHGISVRTLVDRLSANVPLNFSLYIIFFVISSTFHPLFFYLPQRFPLNSPPISHYTIKYHFLYILFIYYKFFIY